MPTLPANRLGPNLTAVAPHPIAPWQRLCLRLCALSLLLSLLVILEGAESAYARQTPNRRDRRPDRETRIRYPQPQEGSNRRSTSTTLHSAPPATATPAPPPANPTTASGD